LKLAALLSMALAAAPSAAFAAKSDSQLWTNGNLTVKLSDHWRISEEGTVRFSDNRNGLYELEANTLLGYRLNKVVTLWAGYTHNPQYSAGHFTVMEHRIREQVTFDNVVQLCSGKLSFRLRGEERWRTNIEGTGVRFRPYVKYSVPLGHSKTSLVLSSETFLNLNTTPFQKQSGLDRVRNLIAINTPLSKKLTAEIGYLNQHGFVRGGPDTSDHVASVSLSLSL